MQKSRIFSSSLNTRLCSNATLFYLLFHHIKIESYERKHSNGAF